MIKKKQHRVVALAYDRLCTFEFGCVVELFALHRPELNVDWYDFKVCAIEPGPLTAAGGITVTAPYGLAALDKADTIVIPGWRDADEPPPPALTKKLYEAHQRGARLCSICSGVFVLAAAGVLDGKTVTTHWRYADRLAARYPTLTVSPNALYVDEGQILTSAGSAAGLDMLLHLVRRDYGPKTANQVAQRLVIPPHRDGDQAQYVPRAVNAEDSRPLSKLLDWIRVHLSQEHTVESLAARAAMSPRTLLRRFKDATGHSPYEWILRERIAAARDLLESSKLPLSTVATRTGFGSDESFRRHFRRAVGVSPLAYQRRFRQVQPKVAAAR